MMHPIDRRTLLKGLTFSALLPTGFAHGETNYPIKPIKLLMPSPAGSTFDTIGRSASIEAGKRLGQPIIIDYHTGAGGTPSFLQAKNAAPDGYTLVVLSLSTVRQPLLEDVGFDGVKDFTWIASLAEINFGVLVQQDSPFKTWADLLAYGKAHQDKIFYGAPSGLGNSAHIFTSEIASKEKLQWTPVPFRASSDTMSALLAGQLTFSTDTLISATPLVKGGKLRFLAMATRQRVAAFPDVPTMQELGYSVSIESPIGIGGPPGMDPAIVKKVQDAYKAATEQPSFISLLAKSTQRPWYMDASEFRKFAERSQTEQRSLLAKYGLLAKSN